MKTENINIGQIYLIKGDYGGCGSDRHRTKCKDCIHFKGKMKATGFGEAISDKKRCISGHSLIRTSDTCTFDPRDLVPVSWRARYES